MNIGIHGKTVVLLYLKRHFFLLCVSLLAAFRSFAQEQPVQGIVFDRDTKQRISKVYLYNLRTHSGRYNNGKGEFNLNVKMGDTLVLAADGYRADTTTVRSFTTLLLYLKSTSILLKEIRLMDTTRSPKEQYDRQREVYRDIYRIGNSKDLLTLGGVNGIGAGLSIDALYSLFSREGKNARFLQEVLERDYRDAMIDYRYSPSLVSQATGLKGESLKDFMNQYRPAYSFVVAANDYALIDFIRKMHVLYLKNPAAYRLPPLVPKN